MIASVRRAAWPTLAVLALVSGFSARWVGASWGAPCLLHIDEMGYNLHNAARTEFHLLHEGWWRPDLISYGSIPVRAFVAVRSLAFGDAIALLERGARRLVPLGAALVLGPLCMTQLQTIRYAVPALSLLALCAARVVTRLLDAREEASDTASRAVFTVAVFLGALALAHGCALSVAQTAVYTEQDNRVAAARWLAAHVKPGDRVILEDHPTYSPPLGNEWGEGVATLPQRVPYERLWVGGEDPAAVRDFLRGARYVVLNGWNDRLVDVPEFRRRHPGEWSFYAGVRRHGAPSGFREVARFENRPHLGAWRRDERASEILHVAFDHLPLRIYERRAGP